MYNVIDLHCDTIPLIYDMRKNGSDVLLRKNQLHIDLNRMKSGGYLCQCFSLYTNLEDIKKYKKDGEQIITPYNHVCNLIQLWEEEIGKNSDLIKKALSYQDIVDNKQKGIMSAIMTVEEGGVYEGSIEKMQDLYKKGVRISNLTWNFQNELAYPNPSNIDFQPDVHNGLTRKGIEMIEEMNRIGMLIDISHLNDAGIMDVFRHTKGPIIATHSNARGVCKHLRNVTDQMIHMIATRGGVIGVNFYSIFLNEQILSHQIEPKTYIEDIIVQMKYLKQVGGIDVISLGTDFDGMEGELEIQGAGKMQILADKMLEAGFRVEEIEKIFYRNAMRVFQDVL